MSEPRYIPIRSFTDERGILHVLEIDKEIPFEVKRIFWFSDCTRPRGGDHKAVGDYLISAVRGSVKVTTDLENFSFWLHERYDSLFIPEGRKVTLDLFSWDSLILVLSNKLYE